MKTFFSIASIVIGSISWLTIFYFWIFWQDANKHPIVLKLLLLLLLLYPVFVIIHLVKGQSPNAFNWSLPFFISAAALFLVVVGYLVYMNAIFPSTEKNKQAEARKLLDTASRDFVCEGMYAEDVEFLTRREDILTKVYFHSKIDKIEVSRLGSFVNEGTVDWDPSIASEYYRDCKNKDGKTIFDVYKIINK